MFFKLLLPLLFIYLLEYVLKPVETLGMNIIVHFFSHLTLKDLIDTTTIVSIEACGARSSLQQQAITCHHISSELCFWCSSKEATFLQMPMTLMTRQKLEWTEQLTQRFK